jgi:hypothetical protein
MRRRFACVGRVAGKRGASPSAEDMDFLSQSFYDLDEMNRIDSGVKSFGRKSRLHVSIETGIQKEPAPPLWHPHQFEGNAGDRTLSAEIRVADRGMVAADPHRLSLFMVISCAAGVAV